MSEQERADKLRKLHGYIVLWRQDKAHMPIPTEDSLNMAEAIIRDLVADASPKPPKKDEFECPACKGTGLRGGPGTMYSVESCNVCGETGVVTEARANAWFLGGGEVSPLRMAEDGQVPGNPCDLKTAQ